MANGIHVRVWCVVEWGQKNEPTLLAHGSRLETEAKIRVGEYNAPLKGIDRLIVLETQPAI